MITRINSGPLPKQHKIEDLFKGRVIKRESTFKDVDVNSIIQRNGAQQPGLCPRSEAAWYYKNKGYSKKVMLQS